MNIAIVCPYDIGRPGGVQTHILDSAAAMADLGHRIVIVAPRSAGAHAEPAPHPSVRIVRIGEARKIKFAGTEFEISIARGQERRDLAALLQQGGFDVVHYHTMWTPLLPLQAFRLSRSANVATFHDTPPDTAGGRVLRAVFTLLGRILLPRLDGAIAVSEAPRRHLLGARGPEVHVVPPCTDLQRFKDHVAAEAHTDGPVTILFLGRLEKRKGAMILLRAFHRLRMQGIAARLVIAGTGSEDAALHDYIKNHDVPDVMFAGAFAAAETPAFYAACDIFCAPSPFGESFGIVVAEAMASGKPVVAAANHGYRTLLTGEAARFLVPPDDAEAIYERLRDLATDPALRARLGAWGRREAMRYDCRAVVPRLLAIYEDAIARAGQHTPITARKGT